MALKVQMVEIHLSMVILLMVVVQEQELVMVILEEVEEVVPVGAEHRVMLVHQEIKLIIQMHIIVVDIAVVILEQEMVEAQLVEEAEERVVMEETVVQVPEVLEEWGINAILLVPMCIMGVAVAVEYGLAVAVIHIQRHRVVLVVEAQALAVILVY
jgi:hypothetical protein